MDITHIEPYLIPNEPRDVSSWLSRQKSKLDLGDRYTTLMYQYTLQANIMFLTELTAWSSIFRPNACEKLQKTHSGMWYMLLVSKMLR